MTTVTLHGELATAVGRAEWELQLDQPREAIAAIEANTGKLNAYLLRRHEESKGAVQYRVLVDGRDIGGPESDRVSPEFYLVGVFLRIDIVPVLQGAGGLWQTIIGVVLIVVGVVLAFTPLSAIAPYVIMAGIGMTLGGVSQMLSPSPKLGASSFARSFMQPDEISGKKEAPEATPSYLFSGAVNTTQQGNPVPVCYGGPIIVGSQLVSFAITGATIAEATIGAQKPPAEDSAFYDLPVWARLPLDPRAELVPTHRAVRQASVGQVKSVMAPGLGLPDNYPAAFAKLAGQPIPVGNASLPKQSLRDFLDTLVHFFNGNPAPVTWHEALDLYKVLEVGDTTNIARTSWKDIVLAIALFLSPEP